MLNQSKIFVAFVFVFALIFSSVSFLPSTVAAGPSIAVYSGKFSKYFEVKLQDMKKSANVTIQMWPTSNQFKNYTVRMTDERGNYIWGEDGAISWNGSRNFYLGNDHKVYRIYIRANGGRGNVSTAFVTSHSNAIVKAR